MHTLWSDGRSSVAEMIEAATQRGLRAIALTEHVNAQSHWYPRFVEEVKRERAHHPRLEVYFGAEIAVADFQGNLKTSTEHLETELLLGVVHRYPRRDGRGVWDFSELTAADAVELELQALGSLAKNPAIDVLGHPGGTAYRKFGPFPVQWLAPAFRAARDRGIAVEINTKYLWDIEGLLDLLEEVNPLVSFGSDAHEGEEVGAKHGLLHQLLKSRRAIS